MPRCSEGCFNEGCVKAKAPALLREVPTALTLRRSDNVIALLRDALERAEKGEIAAVAIAYEVTSGGGGHQVAHGAHTYPAMLVGHLQAASFAITERHLVGRES